MKSILLTTPLFLAVLGAFQIKEHNLLIMNNFTDIYALGKNGTAWQTKSLASDDLVIESIDEEQIKGRASENGRPILFVVNVQNGNILESSRLTTK